MMHSRREFLYLSSATLAALAVGRSTCNDVADDRIRKFGLQLYTVRDLFEKDPKGTLKQLAEMGYQQIEGYERAQGIFWGMTNKEFKKYMDELKMEFISSHIDAEKDLEKKAAESAEIGMKYLIHAWEGSDRTIDGYKRLAEDFNRWGEVCKKNGIKFAFHNHYFSFEKRDGQIPQAILLENTDASLVDYELDIYWAVSVGQDPEYWLKKYPNRFRLCHVKDRVKGTTKIEDTCDLGTGSINFPQILRTAKDNGVEYYFAEQEHYPNSTPMQSAKANAEYMRKIRV